MNTIDRQLSYLIVSTFLTLLLLTFLSNAHANDPLKKGKDLVIKGMITSTKGEPVSFANVAVLGTVKGTYTNADGTFAIYDLQAGQYQVCATAIGFKTITQSITVVPGNTQVLTLQFAEENVEMPEIYVIANKDRIFGKVPGSVSFFDQKELQAVNPISGNEVLRRSPGVHVVDEEGVGMRANIGIRGLDPDRSRSVLVLEDGIPVALAPYGEPELYYTPTIDRMIGVEIVKGSGQILYGPQTIGGVVNYITASPPQEEKFTLNLQGGQGGFFSGLVGYGNTVGNTGIQVNLLRKSANNIGPTEFTITDFNTTLLFDLGEKSTLGVKLGVYDEVSNST
ncbi:MAG: carboxypeptidase-like regulatory domain-containing protein, partial [Cyclobacteriaceae bacterium]